MNESNITLEFSGKYDSKHSLEYYKKHKDSIGRRLSNRREQSMAEKALAIAGNPASILDLPCGAGRFWPLYVKTGQNHICIRLQPLNDNDCKTTPGSLLDQANLIFSGFCIQHKSESGFS